MKACFQIAECSISYAKKLQTSTMKACFQIAECSISYAKIANSDETARVISKKHADYPKKFRYIKIAFFPYP